MIKMKFFQTVLKLCAIAVVLGIYGCGNTDVIEERLNLAEDLMEICPDSSLFILDGISDSELRGRKCKARYALLKSMALDKNYIDTTTFDVLQPAINYYLTRGNADERLRTLYYKGRIHRNAGEDDSAMQSYLNALNFTGHITDSLTLARLLVAQGILFYKQYRVKEFVDNNIRAGELYGKSRKIGESLRCYSKALDGETRRRNKSRADSLASMCKDIINEDSTNVDKQVLQALFEYTISFGNINEIKEFLHNLHDESPDCMGVDFARAYSKIGEPDRALSYLESVKIVPDNIIDSLTYWVVKSEIFNKLGVYDKALESHRNYSRLLEDYHLKIFSNELLFSEKKHELELENMTKLRKRDRMIKWISVGAAVLLIIALLAYYRYRLNKAARILAERDVKRLESEEKALRLENENLQLEGENHRLIAENLESEGRELREKNEKLQIDGERQRLLAERLIAAGEQLRLREKKLILERNRLQSEAEKLQKESEALREDSEYVLQDRARLQLKAETLKKESERLRKDTEQLELERDSYRRKNELLECDGERLRHETAQLEQDRDNYRLKCENLKSERDELQLEAENLHHKIEEMEGEQTRLKELLDSQEAMSEEARQLIRERIGLLNGLIAQALTEQESYGKEFKSYIAKIKKDRNGFQESLVKMFETTHPDFMAYLRAHGLSERELRYACLYAMGMRGKEIGSYLDLARHYNISSEVRRKLGLDPNDRNLGPFLRNHLTRHK